MYGIVYGFLQMRPGYFGVISLQGTLYGLTRVARGSAVSETRDIDCGHGVHEKTGPATGCR